MLLTQHLEDGHARFPCAIIVIVPICPDHRDELLQCLLVIEPGQGLQALTVLSASPCSREERRTPASFSVNPATVLMASTIGKSFESSSSPRTSSSALSG